MKRKATVRTAAAVLLSLILCLPAAASQPVSYTHLKAGLPSGLPEGNLIPADILSNILFGE